MDRTAIHALLRRPGTHEIDLAATLQAGESAASQAPSSAATPSKATAKGSDSRFGLVSEDGIKALFGGSNSSTEPSPAPSNANGANSNPGNPPQQPTESHATEQQATCNNEAPQAAAPQQVEHAPTPEDMIEAAKVDEHEQLLRKQAHNQYMRFFRGLRDTSTLS